MNQDFQFEEDGNTFYCSVEEPRHAGSAAWWWFRLETGGTTRYAPFEAATSDTKKSVQKRILSYYAELLAIKARPVNPKPFWKKPEPAAPVAVVVPTAAIVD